MKLGIIISLVLVVVIGGIVFLGFWGVADAPTNFSSAEKLTKQSLPQDLPALFTSADPGGDAASLYQDAMDFYQQNESVLDEESPPQRIADMFTERLVKAMNAGKVNEGFLDKDLPVWPQSLPESWGFVEAAVNALSNKASKLFESNPAQAESYAQAMFALGHRAFTQNVRLWYREQGLRTMEFALGILRELARKRSDTKAIEGIDRWTNAVSAIQGAWDAKVKFVRSVKFEINDIPRIADLAHFATSDGDVTFRIEAVLGLGYAKFLPSASSRGNQRLIDGAIAGARAADEPLLKEAGKVAEEFTQDDVRKLGAPVR